MKKFAAFFVEIAPKEELSRLLGFYSSKALRGSLGRMAIKMYARYFKVNLDEIEKPVEEYESLNEFFTRKLKEGARPVDARPETLVSPADATVSQFGDIDDLALIQAKGKSFHAGHLLGDLEFAREFKNGKFITLYLSPRDYHRLHMPVEGEVFALRHIPGRLFSVNAFGVNNISSLYSVNERVVNYLSFSGGKIAYVMVGAMNVGRITLLYSDIKTNKRQPELFFRKFYYPVKFKKGDEIGRFELGSTVILLFQNNSVDFLENLEIGKKYLVGEPFAVLKNK